MAEERDLRVARAIDTDDEDATKEELQRRMEEARESISQTVTEIKDTVTNQYQAVKQSVTEALDWREQYRKRPLVWNVSALSVGFIVGYSLGGAFMGGEEEEYHYTEYEEDYEPRARAAERSSVHAPSYAAQAITGASAAYGQAPSASAAPPSAGGYSAATGDEAAEAEKPSLLERFKETRAYDRLQEEVSNLGDRLLDELSNVGRTVVLPALFTKIKDLFGVDLSGKRQGQGGGAAGAQAASATSTGGASASGGTQAAGGAGTSAPRREEGRTQTSGAAASGVTGGGSI
jgi:hypothetical protein